MISCSDANTTDGNADHVGADGPGKITQVVGFGGDRLATAHNFQVVGQFGTLVLTENGDYIYPRTSASVGTDHFTYTLSDHDGDTSTATLTINLDGSRLDQRPTFTGTVEEEELGNTASPPLFPSSFVGNEDTTSALADDTDTAGNFHITTNVTTNTFIVFGGTGPYTYSFAGGIEGTQAQTHSPNAMTSHGAPVYFHIDSGNPNLLIGYADGVGGTADSYDAGIDRVVFTFQINPTTGQGTFSLYDNIDHHTVAAADDVEGTRLLNLNGIVEVTDSSPSPQTLLLNGSIAIIDDVPIISTGPSSASLTVDKSFLTTDATTSFAAAFIPLFGADGPAANGSKVFALNAIAGASGLVDTATGEAVDLSVVGGVVFGKTHTTGLTVFTVSVDGSGNVTLDQQRAIVHPDTGDPNIRRRCLRPIW